MVLIIGAGLSGLLTAYRLKKAGIPFKVLEARARIGGRINTVVGTPGARVEMGATWFNEQHTNLIALLDELGLSYYEQYMNGRVYFQRTPTSATEIIAIPPQAASYRIAGGTAQLINALYQTLDTSEVLLNQTVTEIKWKHNKFQVIAHDTFEADDVVLALPPKLWAKTIAFEPALPNKVTAVAQETHTWMEDSIKVALTYETPFWDELQLPSSMYSNVGPITEFYDHCDYERTTYALCGFIHSSFKEVSDEERQRLVIAQLTAVFGNEAAAFTHYEECVWSTETFTFTASKVELYPHQNNGNAIFNASYFDNHLFISSAEAGLTSAGYMDGAVYAGNGTAGRIIDAHGLL